MLVRQEVEGPINFPVRSLSGQRSRWPPRIMVQAYLLQTGRRHRRADGSGLYNILSVCYRSRTWRRVRLVSRLKPRLGYRMSLRLSGGQKKDKFSAFIASVHFCRTQFFIVLYNTPIHEI